MTSQNSNILQSKVISLTPNWITGITDAEGNFSVNFNYKNNKISFSYKITQNQRSLDTLYYNV